MIKKIVKIVKIVKNKIKETVNNIIGTIKKIAEIINNIADDKKDHVLLGMIVGYPLMFIGLIIDLSFGINYMTIIGGLLGILIVGAKEIIYDGWMKKRNVELADFIYSAVPIITPMIFHIV